MRFLRGLSYCSLTAVTLAVGFLVAGPTSGCTQPSIDCRAARGDFAVKFTKVKGECGGFSAGFIGLQSFYPNVDGKQDFDHPYLTMQSEVVGLLYQDSQYYGPDFIDLEHKAYAQGDFTTVLPDENGVCSVPKLTESEQDIPEVPGETGGGGMGGSGEGGATDGGGGAGGGTGGAAEGGAGMGGAGVGGGGEGGAAECPEPGDPGPFPGVPATDIKVVFSNVKVLVSAASPGTQFVADLDYSENIDGVECSATYRVVGIWPVVDCGIYEYDDCGNLVAATPSDEVCHLTSETAAPGSVLIDPSFTTVCDPDYLICVATKPVDALK